jgi:poly-gamma-glutamate capsule biosynthesis protein CapA/YwtB (metallophosphatase superfamily)
LKIQERRLQYIEYEFLKLEADITDAKEQSDFVIVSVQYWECYAYPEGYIEYPECDGPIGEQESVFKKVIDYGADMVVGSSAHQPQTYEFYRSKPIYYGLGNLYFDQTSWPGTERSIVLTHYFANGKLLQTKLTPTVYSDDLQTRLMTDDEAAYLLGRLNKYR